MRNNVRCRWRPLTKSRHRWHNDKTPVSSASLEGATSSAAATFCDPHEPLDKVVDSVRVLGVVFPRLLQGRWGGVQLAG